jgi:hypothetical protein
MMKELYFRVAQSWGAGQLVGLPALDSHVYTDLPDNLKVWTCEDVAKHVQNMDCDFFWLCPFVWVRWSNEMIARELSGNKDQQIMKEKPPCILPIV